jgi:hypothetical protein
MKGYVPAYLSMEISDFDLLTDANFATGGWASRVRH